MYYSVLMAIMYLDCMEKMFVAKVNPGSDGNCLNNSEQMITFLLARLQTALL